MRILAYVALLSLALSAHAEDGYRLWLRYDQLQEPTLSSYRKAINSFLVDGQSSTGNVISNELSQGLSGLLGKPILPLSAVSQDGVVIVTQLNSKLVNSITFPADIATKPESYVIQNAVINKRKVIIIAGTDEAGMLYGAFAFLRALQTNADISKLSIVSTPRIKIRILNHWDNLDRTVERGYAGFSLWDWHRLPEYVDPRYTDYARANASIGINATVLTNVNANALILTPAYLEKVKAIADVLRPFKIRVFLTARFSAPIEIGNLKTADPLDPEVAQWWKTIVNSIYQYIPDFGGFVVKANSEGQPGPQNYQRTHADGANMLADALTPHRGIVMWRAFVYDNNVPVDRAAQAYNEFEPLDGQFRNNVIIQVKNGPIDFQPREPFHPLFGAMTKTPLMMEFQITQEYLGQATHLVWMGKYFKETLDADTYAIGKGSTVAKVVDGSINGHALTAMAGVTNIGDDRNWCGHLFGQANWYAFGRLAWDHSLSASAISDEWIRLTFGNHKPTVDLIARLHDASREMIVNYMTPLGLHHIMGANHHFGPGPWVNKMSRADWTSTYYHKADQQGIGFDRTSTGSNSLSQYSKEVQLQYGTANTCPEELLLWFHHVPWDFKMKSGRALWDEICLRYQQGYDDVVKMKADWGTLKGKIDDERFLHVSMLLERQRVEADMWRESCILYFHTFSNKPIPSGVSPIRKTLEYYQSLQYPYAPGIRPRW